MFQGLNLRYFLGHFTPHGLRRLSFRRRSKGMKNKPRPDPVLIGTHKSAGRSLENEVRFRTRADRARAGTKNQQVIYLLISHLRRCKTLFGVPAWRMAPELATGISVRSGSSCEVPIFRTPRYFNGVRACGDFVGRSGVGAKVTPACSAKLPRVRAR